MIRRGDVQLGHIYKLMGKKVLVTDYADDSYGLFHYTKIEGEKKGQKNVAHCSWFHYVGPYAGNNMEAAKVYLDKEW